MSPGRLPSFDSAQPQSAGPVGGASLEQPSINSVGAIGAHDDLQAGLGGRSERRLSAADSIGVVTPGDSTQELLPSSSSRGGSGGPVGLQQAEPFVPGHATSGEIPTGAIPHTRHSSSSEQLTPRSPWAAGVGESPTNGRSSEVPASAAAAV